MKTLYTIGCSFTNYGWPTWANISATNFDAHVARGQPGAGNELIFHQLNEIITVNDLTEDDTIMLCWSSSPRLDVCFGKHWVVWGNLFNSGIDPIILREMFSDEGSVYKSINYIHAACNLLSKSRANWKMMFMTNLAGPKLEREGYPYLDDYFNRLHRYDDHIVFDPIDRFARTQHMPSFISDEQKIITDSHPTPITHLKFVERYLPEINITEETREIVSNANDFVMSTPRVSTVLSWWEEHPWSTRCTR